MAAQLGTQGARLHAPEGREAARKPPTPKQPRRCLQTTALSVLCMQAACAPFACATTRSTESQAQRMCEQGRATCLCCYDETPTPACRMPTCSPWLFFQPISLLCLQGVLLPAPLVTPNRHSISLSRPYDQHACCCPLLAHAVLSSGVSLLCCALPACNQRHVLDRAGPEERKRWLAAGAVAGFQWATSAGPLCEEPIWGVAFELDARLVLPASATHGANGHAASAAQASAQGCANGGSPEGQQQQQGSTEEPSPVLAELQEDVYGPFSGQVRAARARACVCVHIKASGGR